MTKISKAHVWARGLFSALISGGASALASSTGAIMLAPESFNLDGGLRNTIALAGISAAIGAVSGVANYLKQSPLPPPEEDAPAA